MDGRSWSRSEGSPRTNATLAYRNHDGHLRSARTREPASGRDEDDGNGGSQANTSDNHQLNLWNEMERISTITGPQVIEKLVELVGIEPTTSSLRTMRSPS